MKRHPSKLGLMLVALTLLTLAAWVQGRGDGGGRKTTILQCGR